MKPRPSDEPRTYFIYALVDPRTKLIAYVGCSEQLNRRIRSHQVGRLPSTQPRLGKWLAELRNSGLEPQSCLVAEVKFHRLVWHARRTALDIEKEVIGILARSEPPLMNIIGNRRSGWVHWTAKHKSKSQ
jgi:hypothetical protein